MGAVNIRPEVLLIAAGAVVAGLLLAGKNAGKIGDGLGSAAVDMVDGVISGGVLTIGDKIGIDRTNISQGQAELAAGDYWNASFHLPAGEFIAGSWNRIFN